MHLINTELWLPRPREEVFPFFADARNLQALTPDWLHFQVLTPDPIVMRPGARIDYQLRLHGIPVKWQSEITEWDPPHRFVDEQRRGPYKLWKHEHIFAERNGSTLVIDRVVYAVPGGALVHFLFVQRDVNRIFEYRRLKLRELFGQEDNKPGLRRA